MTSPWLSNDCDSLPVFKPICCPYSWFGKVLLSRFVTFKSKDKIYTFNGIVFLCGTWQTVIDVLKIDIEYSEWESLRNMMSTRTLANVKQLIFELHTAEVERIHRTSTKEDFADMYAVLRGLELAGFRRFHYHYNPLGRYTSAQTGKTRTCCYELYYVNIRFLSQAPTLRNWGEQATFHSLCGGSCHSPHLPEIRARCSR